MLTLNSTYSGVLSRFSIYNTDAFAPVFSFSLTSSFSHCMAGARKKYLTATARHYILVSRKPPFINLIVMWLDSPARY